MGNTHKLTDNFNSDGGSGFGGGGYSNIVNLNLDLYSDSWDIFVEYNRIDYVHVDALHDYGSVLSDARGILSKLSGHAGAGGPRKIIFHDWYLAGIRKAILNLRFPLVRYVGSEDWRGSGMSEGIVVEGLQSYESDTRLRDVAAVEEGGTEPVLLV